MKPAIVIILFLTVLVILPATTFAQRQGRDDDAPKVGDVAPLFTVKTLAGDKEVSLESYKNDRPVVLIFGSYT